MTIEISSGRRNKLIFVSIASLLIFVGTACAQGPRTNRLPGNIRFVRLVEHSTACDWSTLQFENSPQASNVSGCVRGADQSAGPVHVRMQGHTGTISDTEANKSGEFLFKDVSGGDYFLYITQAAKILAIATISVPSKLRTPMVVDLGPHITNTDILYIGEYQVPKSQ
jgi:hypothetical protein